MVQICGFVWRNLIRQHIITAFRAGVTGTEAVKLFEQQIQKRVKDGFAHSFSIDPYTGMLYEYLGK
jgi:hypothetical protein